MIEVIVKYFNDLLTHISEVHPEGMLLFMVGSLMITTVHIIHFHEFKSGLKGDNRHFEAPEICIYFFTWLFPYSLMADQLLALHPSTYMWYFMAVLLLFGLTGRFGLEWLLAIKNGTKIDDKDEPAGSK